ncbi:nickel/cobalt transporter [Halomonas sp. McH1-25]|uniref:nickel/cobalt transporter n=1 Tax=unclassified Halomonas TaxID=2609666 RepID=UPI001EF73A2C|nr:MULTISPECIES: nickel/cobalt transporter [unclassified Halomonas]MCG7599792.1 nickel/cobalt transporter [Halomonas sp. McH1-25]MCP1341687.1 nickel/cobalt transporter [Halomonas sp. FL8]MCP1359845.1 nickel/cobalt transporter [Halomonas sp. BBD45]
MSRPLALLIALLPLLGVTLLAMTDAGQALAQAVMAQTHDWQRELHRGLTLSTMALSRHPSFDTSLSLMALSLGYGVFHALGPGHGKAVITAYLLSHPTALRRGLVLTVAAALLQGLVAILLVGVLVWGMGLLTREAMARTGLLEQASFIVLAGLGAWLTWRALVRLKRSFERLTYKPDDVEPHTNFLPMDGMAFNSMGNAFAHAAPMMPSATLHTDTACDHCGGHHHIDPGVTHDAKESLGALLAIGLRPCSGAVMVLGVASLLGYWWAGVLAVLAMSVGTAITTSCLAMFAVFARQRATRLLARTTPHWQALAGHGLALCGGILILALGLGLLLSAPEMAATGLPGGLR